MRAGLDCTDERRPELIRQRGLNGIDSVDVVGARLCVRFLTRIPPEFEPLRSGGLSAEAKRALLAHVQVGGGRSVRNLQVVDLSIDEAQSEYEESCLGVQLDREGDWSTYQLCLVQVGKCGATGAPLASLDPRYACVDFTFKTDCSREIDCKESDEPCEDPVPATPELSYLAKDYATLRQLIFDRLALTMPEWRERHVPDIGVTLVELMAYVGDHLSYYQDAVGTEQYLSTARRRISVRRHARLVDYPMHEGCNARAFVILEVSQNDDSLSPGALYFLTSVAGLPVAVKDAELGASAASALRFEPIALRPRLKLRQAHNRIAIYTWGNARCCLARGATTCTLLDEPTEQDHLDPGICDERPWPPTDRPHKDPATAAKAAPPPSTPRILDLAKGDLLLFEELACAGTVDSSFDGVTALPDADPTHRHVVRLTQVSRGCDALRGNRVLEVEWSEEDALPVPALHLGDRHPARVRARGRAGSCPGKRGLGRPRSDHPGRASPACDG